jgi:hypothetical protein
VDNLGVIEMNGVVVIEGCFTGRIQTSYPLLANNKSDSATGKQSDLKQPLL